MDEPSVRQWANAYARAWEHSDPEAVVALFTPNASYRSLIFSEPHLGTDGIRAYWERATATQGDVHVWMGDPLVDGERATLEWWTIMNEEDEGPITLPGCLLGTPGRWWCQHGAEPDPLGHRCARGQSDPGGHAPYRHPAKKIASQPSPSAACASSGMGRGSATASTVPYFITLRNQTCDEARFYLGDASSLLP